MTVTNFSDPDFDLRFSCKFLKEGGRVMAVEGYDTSGAVPIFFRKAFSRSIGGSESELVESIKRLCSSLTRCTKVFPGHGQSTDFGSEKNTFVDC